MQIGNKKPALSTRISRTPPQRMQRKMNKMINIDEVISTLLMSIDNVTNLGFEEDGQGSFELEEDEPNFCPAYDYYNKKLAIYITIYFIGKTEQEKMYWNIDNPSGYFAQHKGFNESDLLGNQIKKHLQERGLDNYDITAIVIYEKDIEKNSSIDDLEVKSDVYSYLYHFKNNHWIIDKAEKIDTDFINEVLK